MARILSNLLPPRADGRLTALTGSPITDGIGAYGNTLYYTPYIGNKITLFYGGLWREFAFSEISIDNSGVGQNEVHDVFAYWNGSSVALEFSATYTAYVTRVDAVTRLNGILVKNSDHTRRLIGTIMSVSTGHLTPPYLFLDTINARLISNLYNAVPSPMSIALPGANDNALTEDHVDCAGGIWTVPLYIGGEPMYASWVACEPRQVDINWHVTLRKSTATIMGAGIGLTAGDDDWDTGTIIRACRTTLDRLETNLQLSYMSSIGAWIAWAAYFAEGGDEKLYVEMDDKRRGADADPYLTIFYGSILA